MKATDTNDKIVDTKGIKIQTLSWVCAIISILLLLFVAHNLNRVVGNYKQLVEEFNLHLGSHEYVDDLQNGSDDMTEQSRLFVATQNPECMLKYFEIVNNKIRETAKENTGKYFIKMGYKQSVQNLDKALAESDALMDYEIHSMKLMVQALDVDESIVPEQVKKYQLPEGEENWSNAQKQNYASELVFGDAYRHDKAQIDSDIMAAVASISENLEGDISKGINNMWDVIGYMIVSCILLAILFVVVFILIVDLIIRPLHIFAKCIKENRAFEIVGAYEFQYLASTYNNIYELNQENKARMNFELEHDTLTNAYSRLAFDEQKRLLAETQMPIALLVIDVYHFKDVNDLYGHDVGDVALKKIATTLNQLLRNEDIVARIGGDEFAVILMKVYEYSAEVIGEKINRINHILMNPQDGGPKLSISVGMAFSENGYNEDLFRHADRALYETKSAGRCGYRIYKKGKDE